MNRKLKAVLISREGEKLKIEPMTIEDTLETYYKLCECRTIDIISRTIKGRVVDFIVDDEYLLSDKPKNAPTGIFQNEPMLEQIYGPFVITGTGDNEGNLTDLNDLDIKAIKSSVLMATRQKGDDLENVERFETLAYTI